MHICLSSGARPRYREDIVRALAMPEGTHLAFRYDQKWVDPNVIRDLREWLDDPFAYSKVAAPPIALPLFANILDSIGGGHEMRTCLTGG